MKDQTNRRQSYVTLFVFCLLIFGFTAATSIKSPTKYSETENRILTQMPEVNLEAISRGEFETDYEEYLTDQFVFRDQWIGLKTAVERLLLKQESKDIYFAKDGYLIEKHTGSFSTQLAQRNIAALTTFVRQYGAQLGAGHISVLIAPNAVDMLQDKLPPFAAPGDGNNYLEQIKASLPEDTWLDSASVLREHTQEEIYYRTDHHWKTLGAFYVYQAWASEQGYHVPELADYKIKVVTDSFEGTIQSQLGIQTAGDTIELFFPDNAPTYTAYRESTGATEYSIYNYDALETKDKYAVFFGGNESFLKIRTDAENGRRILVIKDSYANCFIPFMLREFQQVDVLDLRYTNQKLSELVPTGEYTDILLLYNVSGFAEDLSISKLLN